LNIYVGQVVVQHRQVFTTSFCLVQFSVIFIHLLVTFSSESSFFFVFCDINLQLRNFLVTLYVVFHIETVFVYNDDFVPTAGFL